MGMSALGFNWWWITVITMTKYFEDFQEPAGHLYPSFDVKRFVPALQSDKKLPIIWYRSSDLPSPQSAFRSNGAFY